MSKKPTKKTTPKKPNTKSVDQAVSSPSPERAGNRPGRRVHVFAITALLLGVLVAVIAGLWTSSDNYQADGDAKDGTTITVTGEYVCLPHDDTTGPQTLECAFGLKTDKGVYYGLYFSDTATQIRDLATGDRLKVTGQFDEEDTIYQSIGRISVDDVKEL